MDSPDTNPRSRFSGWNRTILGLILLPVGLLFVVNLAYAVIVLSDPLVTMYEHPMLGWLICIGLWVFFGAACAASFLTTLCTSNGKRWVCLMLCGAVGFSIVVVAINVLVLAFLFSRILVH